jgi:hypothetical protein
MNDHPSADPHLDHSTLYTSDSVGRSYEAPCPWCLQLRIAELERIERAANLLDDAICEFGVENPAYISEAAQVLHDLLHRTTKPERVNVPPSEGLDTPWPLRDVLTKLIDATEHLLDDHDCDAHGHEEYRAAAKAGKGLLARRDAQPPEGSQEARHLLSCAMVMHPNCTHCDCGSSIDSRTESRSGGNPGEKSESRRSDHPGIQSARSSEGGNGENVSSVSIQSREPVGSDPASVGAEMVRSRRIEYEYEVVGRLTLGQAAAIAEALAHGSVIWVRGHTFPCDGIEIRPAIETGGSRE